MMMGQRREEEGEDAGVASLESALSFLRLFNRRVCPFDGGGGGGGRQGLGEGEVGPQPSDLDLDEIEED